MPKTRPEGHVFAVGHAPSPSPLTNAVPHPPNTFPTSQTPERARVGAFWCSGMSPPISLVSNTRTCPHRHVLVLGHLPSPFPSSQTQERARVGSFLCSGTSPPPCPLLCCSACPVPLPCLEHHKCAQIGIYFYISIVSSFVLTFYIKIKIMRLIFFKIKFYTKFQIDSDQILLRTDQI